MKKTVIKAGLAMLALSGALLVYKFGAQTSVLSGEKCDFGVFPSEFDINFQEPTLFQILDFKPTKQNFKWKVANGKLTVSADSRNAVLLKRTPATVIIVESGDCRMEIGGVSLQVRTSAVSALNKKDQSNPARIVSPGEKPLTLPYPPLSLTPCEKLKISPKDFLPDINEQAFTANIEPAEFSGVVKWTHSKNGKILEIKTGFRAIFANLDAVSRIEAQAFPKKAERNCSISVLPE